jgi:hypothetical protein
MIDAFKKHVAAAFNGEFLNTDSFKAKIDVSFLFNDIPMVCTIDTASRGFVLTRNDTERSCKFSVGYNRNKGVPQISWENEFDTVDLDLRVAVDVLVAAALNTAVDHGLDPKTLPQFPIKK